MLDQLGPAVNSGKSVFLYGPPGNGKTVARRRHRPRARRRHVRPVGARHRRPDHHDLRPGEPRDASTTEATGWQHSSSAWTRDRRWVRVKRPVVTVGGELTLEMLDLSFNAIAKFYEAPLQMKANGGVFVVDDFGRQRIRPRDLLNRWIVPLESRVDYLTLHTGKKFEMPVRRADRLRDEPQSRVAGRRGVPAPHPVQDLREEPDARGVRPHLRAELQAPGHRRSTRSSSSTSCAATTSRAASRCAPAIPRDIVEQVVDICRYQARPLVITRELLDQACKNYFLEEQAGTAERAASGRRREGPAARRAPPRAPSRRAERGMAVLSQSLRVDASGCAEDARAAGGCASARRDFAARAFDQRACSSFCATQIGARVRDAPATSRGCCCS